MSNRTRVDTLEIYQRHYFGGQYWEALACDGPLVVDEIEGQSSQEVQVGMLLHYKPDTINIWQPAKENPWK